MGFSTMGSSRSNRRVSPVPTIGLTQSAPWLKKTSTPYLSPLQRDQAIKSLDLYLRQGYPLASIVVNGVITSYSSALPPEIQLLNGMPLKELRTALRLYHVRREAVLSLGPYITQLVDPRTQRMLTTNAVPKELQGAPLYAVHSLLELHRDGTSPTTLASVLASSGGGKPARKQPKKKK